MNNRENLFLDIHVIQSIPPSNINRDDTGSPKTAQYGGQRRARVSSQAWKKVMRDYFREHGKHANVGIRTLEIVSYVAEKIQAIDTSITSEDALKKANKVINNAGIQTKDFRAKALFFISDVQAQQLAEAAVQGIEDKKALQKLLNDKPSIDIALFGRMLADDPSLNEDASAQVAHAISTHAVQTEFDYFTGLDDLAPEDNAGAAMLNTVEFNSATLYRYANVAAHELAKQLLDKQETINTLQLFIEAFANSLPHGKMNSFANQTVPEALLVVLREDRPVNLVTAFEKPVKSKDGYAEESIKRLLKELSKVEKYVDKPDVAFLLTKDDLQDVPDDVAVKTSLKALLDDLSLELEKRLTTF